MREWQLKAGDPLAMRFAADVRLGQTDYTDDQSWEIVLGGPDEPALSAQTTYGGRAGLARIVPMWEANGRAIYESQGFAERPTLRAFAPNYARITANPFPTLVVTFELWVMDSHAVGGRYTLHNTAQVPFTLTFDLFAQVVRNGKSPVMKIVPMDGGVEALTLGVIGNLNPALLLERGFGAKSAENTEAHLSATLTIAPGASAAIRWVHAGNTTLSASMQAARKWLYETDWDAAFRQIEKRAVETPIVETGNLAWDAALAFGMNAVLRGYIGATGKLPHPSFVTAREPGHGFSPHPDGSDQAPEWAGQTAQEGYLSAPTAAILAPDLARGAIRNALAVQQPDGWIDWKPGLGGQRANVLALPLLATTAWAIYEHTEDLAFLKEVISGLSAFVERWFAPDMDRDGDGVPEWTTPEQSAHAESPTFNRVQRWSVNAEISKAESPDLLAYLLMEIRSLDKIALVVNPADPETKPRNARLHERLESLQAQLEALWDEARGVYLPRDRDTHRTLPGVMLFEGKGDEAFSGKTPLDPPNRLVLRVIGGKEHAPRVSAVIEGIDHKGQPASETLAAAAFAWLYGLGTAVTERVYSRINYVKFEGLSRVYTVEIATVDLTRDSLPMLLPLWSDGSAQHVDRLVQTLTNPARYGLPAALPLTPADQPTPDDSGNGHVLMLWNVLIAEGLVWNKQTDAAAALVNRLMTTQINALKRYRAFRAAYDARTGEGIGSTDDINGILPLHLFFELIGLRVINARRVWAGGDFPLAAPVTVTQRGVIVTRSKTGTRVQFPSGYQTSIDNSWQVIEDTSVPKPPTPPPAPAERLIHVEAQRDPTVEVPITHIDFTPKPIDSGTPPEPPPTVKIPVRVPKK